MSESKRQSDRNSRNAKAIAGLLQNQGYDEVLVALGNDGLIGTSIQGNLISCINFSMICVTQIS